MVPARPLAASVVALGIAGVFTVPAPATAAPAPCERAERYAAQSGAELLRLHKLDLRPLGQFDSTGGSTADDSQPASDGKRDTVTGGDDQTVHDVAVAEAKSALVGLATPSAAAVTRMLASSGDSELTKPLLQQAPPTNAKPSTRKTPPAEAGPILIDRGTLSTHAQWEPGMACGATVGKVTTAEATLGQALIASGDDDSLVAVPEQGRSVSTTALERHADTARTVSSASIETKKIELLGGAVHVKIMQAPNLMTSMSTSDGGEVQYRPAVLEVSGEGVETEKLDTVGDSVDLTLGDENERTTESALLGGLLSGLPVIGGLSGASPLPLPSVPGMPSLGASGRESAPVAGPGTRLSISIGDVRQATSGHAIAARAAAIKIALTQGGSEDRSKQGYGGSNAGVVLDLDIGVLEAAAVSPEPSGTGAGVEDASAGLPITGPRVDLLATGGAALLVGGIAALIFGMRKRRFQA